jgi:hypothetical protein
LAKTGWQNSGVSEGPNAKSTPSFLRFSITAKSGAKTAYSTPEGSVSSKTKDMSSTGSLARVGACYWSGRIPLQWASPPLAECLQSRLDYGVQKDVSSIRSKQPYCPKDAFIDASSAIVVFVDLLVVSIDCGGKGKGSNRMQI